MKTYLYDLFKSLSQQGRLILSLAILIAIVLLILFALLNGIDLNSIIQLIS